jgi:hypothetical protein
LTALLAAHAFATLAMTGLIWFVQIVHYPLFASIDRESFSRYHPAHTSRTGFVVIPFMLLEAATALLIVALPGTGVPRVQAGTGLGLLAVVWGSTFLLQVPLHRRLGSGFDAAAIRRLVGTNWVRTITWTARGVLAVLWLAAAT